VILYKGMWQWSIHWYNYVRHSPYGCEDLLRWPRDTLYPQKLGLTSPTSGGRSVGIVRLRAKATEFIAHYIRQMFLTLFSKHNPWSSGNNSTSESLPGICTYFMLQYFWSDLNSLSAPSVSTCAVAFSGFFLHLISYIHISISKTCPSSNVEYNVKFVARYSSVIISWFRGTFYFFYSVWKESDFHVEVFFCKQTSMLLLC
jgi:hypothetical protein